MLLRRHKPHYNDGLLSTDALDAIFREVRTSTEFVRRSSHLYYHSSSSSSRDSVDIKLQDFGILALISTLQ